MQAKKCDRCGTLYECFPPQVYKMKAQTYFGELNFYSLKLEGHTDDYKPDLCPDCLNEFITWFESKVR